MSKRKHEDFEEEIEANKQFLNDLQDQGNKYQHTLDSDESDNEA